jgi:hypothetical protein
LSFLSFITFSTSLSKYQYILRRQSNLLFSHLWQIFSISHKLQKTQYVEKSNHMNVWPCNTTTLCRVKSLLT